MAAKPGNEGDDTTQRSHGPAKKDALAAMPPEEGFTRHEMVGVEEPATGTEQPLASRAQMVAQAIAQNGPSCGEADQDTGIEGTLGCGDAGQNEQGSAWHQGSGERNRLDERQQQDDPVVPRPERLKR